MALAAAPLPLPVSPTRSSVESVELMRLSRAKICRIGTLLPTSSPSRSSTDGAMRTGVSGGLEAQLHVAQLEQLPGLEVRLADLRPVDEGAVGRLEVLDQEPVALPLDDQVVAAHRGLSR